LLEFLALLAALENKVGEGIEMLEHARALYPGAGDQLRTVLYEVEMLRNDGTPPKVMQARALLNRAMKKEAFKGEVGSEALQWW
jgi:hypothetical protein